MHITITVDNQPQQTFSNPIDAIEFLSNAATNDEILDRKKAHLIQSLMTLTKAKRLHSNVISVYQDAVKRQVKHPRDYARNCTGHKMFHSIEDSLQSIENLDVSIAQVRAQLDDLLLPDPAVCSECNGPEPCTCMAEEMEEVA